MKARKIGNFEVSDCPCEHCDEISNQEISVFGRYLHFFWIPIFPLGRKVVSECTYCKKTIPKGEFSPALQQSYQKNKSKAKRPLRHWFGLGLIGVLIVAIIIIDANVEEDPRSVLLDDDMNLMTENPTMESDSISYKIKQAFDELTTEEMDPSEFEYFTKVQNNKVLILVRVPELRHVEKEARNEALTIIRRVAAEQKDLKGKERYIGVQGFATIMLIQTPTYTANSKLALTYELYDFYGPKPETKNN